MIPLTAREALGPQVERVTATTRPSELEEREQGSAIYAVFGEEDGAFLGLVTEQACARFPHRIFADLSAELQPAPVAAETSIEAVHTRMAAEGVEALPVLDENRVFLGVITRPSLLEALLRRERELLAKAQCLQGQLEAEQKRLVAWSKRQEELNQASSALLGLVGQTTLQRELLQEAIQALAMLLQARYGAIGILDEAEGLQQFISTGLTAEEVDRIGAHPSGRGLLGVIIREDRILRLADVAKDPRYTGFPPYHPPMKTLLAVPISHQGKVYGRVYFCDKTTGEPFTEDDERLAVGFTRSLSLAFAHAQELAERTRAEEALREGEERFRSLVQETDAIVWEADAATWKFTFVSQRAEAILGYPVEQWLTEPDFWVNHIHPDDREEAVAYCRTSTLEGRDHNFEYRCVAADGRIIWLRDIVHVIKDAKGRPRQLRGLLVDITAPKRAEEAVHEMNLALANAMPGISRLNPEGRYVSVNEAYARMIGYEPGEMIGMGWERTMHPDDRGSAITAYHRMLREGKAEFEARAMRKDGSLFYKHVLMVKRADEEGKFIGHHCFMKDITERKKTEEALRESELWLRAIFAALEEAVFVVTPERRFVNMNESALRMLGYDMEELKGASTERVHVDHDHYIEFGRRISAAFQRGQVAQFEFELRRKNGEIFPTEHTVSPLRDASGDVIAMVSVVRDITERKRADEALRLSEERFAKAFRSSPDSITISTLTDGRFIEVNDGFTRVTGYRREEVMGRTSVELNLWEDPGDRAKLIAMLREHGKITDIEGRFRAKSGELREGVVSSEIISLAGEQCMVSVVRDITEQKRAEATRQALYRASLQIQEPLTLQERLVHLLETAQTVLELDRVNILLADGEGQWLEAVASSGTQAPLAALRVPTGPAGGGLAQAYQSREMVVWDGRGPVPEPLRLQPPYDQIAAFRSRAFAVLPLVVQGRAIGVMGADRKHTRRPLEPATLELLQLFASQAALAIAQAQLFEEVRSGNERLRNLSRQLVEIQEIERRQIARELHDQIGQALTALNLALEMVARSRDGKSASGLIEAQALVQDLMTRVHDLSLDLRPAMLDDLGLLPALLWHFERYTALTNLHVVFKHVGAEEHLEPEVETAAYRIVQEALTNVARHAKVGHVTVRLWSDLGRLNVQIEDQGVGFDPKALLGAGISSGLSGMRERVELLGGELTIESSPGAGTRVTAELPIRTSVER